MLIDNIGNTGGCIAEALSLSLEFKFPGGERACAPSLAAANRAAVNA